MIENNNFSQSSLPNGWAWVSLGNLVDDPKQDLVDGPFGSNLKSCEYQSDGIPVLKIQNIKRDRFVDKGIDHISSQKADSLIRHSFQSGDLIITKLGAPLGVCCKVPSKYAFGIIVADLMRLRPSKSKVFADYLLQVINSDVIQKQFKSITKGTTRPRVNLAIVREMQIPLPPLPEQHRIVAKIEELFSELDKGVEALKTAQQQLKVYRQAVLQQAFEGKLTEKWRRQQKNLPTAAQLLGQIKAEWEKQAEVTGKKPKPPVKLTEEELAELPALPEGWGWVRMAAISDACLGKMLDANKNKGTPKPYLRNSNVRWNAFDLSDLQKMKFEDGEDERYGVRKGDLIVCEGGEPGRAAIWNDQIPDMKIQKALHRVRLNEFALSKFVLYFLVLSSKNGHLDKYFTGTTIKHLPGEKLAIFPLPLCSVDEQRRTVEEIESRLSVADKIEESITQSLKQAEALRQSILKKAFEGKLVPQDPNDEPAEKLLALIRAERTAQTPLRSRRRPDSRPEALKRGPFV